MRNWFRNFMLGRYGPDQLYIALLVSGFAFMLLSRIRVLWFLIYIAYALLLIAIFRTLSRNIARRRRENDAFIRVWWPLRQKITGAVSRIKSRKTHQFFKCPGCGKTLRVPRGKGKIQITCPMCGERFERKT